MCYKDNRSSLVTLYVSIAGRENCLDGGHVLYGHSPPLWESFQRDHRSSHRQHFRTSGLGDSPSRPWYLPAHVLSAKYLSANVSLLRYPYMSMHYQGMNQAHGLRRHYVSTVSGKHMTSLLYLQTQQPYFHQDHALSQLDSTAHVSSMAPKGP